MFQKKTSPVSVTDFRPISLCNVIFKLISKILANRLKVVLLDIISSTQSAFIPGRLITNNVLVAYETMHSMHTRMLSKVGYMGIKLDMSKAYDRVEWEFLEVAMNWLGFADRWIHLVMTCVRSVSYLVVVNGNPVCNIQPSRGIHQGDPISPYLFLLCAEALSSLLSQEEHKGVITGIPTSPKGLCLSHLFFANDSMLFYKSNLVEWCRLLRILGIYEAGSGQKHNMQKTSIFFSCNTSQDRRQEILRLSGVIEAHKFDTYLGLLALVGQSKNQAFTNIKERLG
jgi:ribosome-associated protein YbcJ (S4-like RNA binding protein)